MKCIPDKSKSSQINTHFIALATKVNKLKSFILQKTICFYKEIALRTQILLSEYMYIDTT